MKAQARNQSRKCARVVLAWLCILNLTLLGCVERRVVAPQWDNHAKNPYRSVSPRSMESYIRTVFRISAENRQSSKILEAADSEAAVELEKKEPAERVQYAAQLIQQGRYYEAHQILEELRRQRPEDSRIHLALAELWARSGDLTLGITFAKQALALDSQPTEALKLLGTLYLKQGRPRQAISFLLRAVEFAPSDLSVLSKAAEAEQFVGDWESARRHLEAAVTLVPNAPWLRNQLAAVLLQLDRQEDALSHLQAVHRAADAYDRLGSLLLPLERWREANRAFRRALELDPAHTGAKWNLAEAQSHLPPPGIVTLESFESTGNRQIASNTFVQLSPQPAVLLQAKGEERVVLAQVDSAQAGLHELAATEPEGLPIQSRRVTALVELPRLSLKGVPARWGMHPAGASSVPEVRPRPEITCTLWRERPCGLRPADPPAALLAPYIPPGMPRRSRLAGGPADLQQSVQVMSGRALKTEVRSLALRQPLQAPAPAPESFMDLSARRSPQLAIVELPEFGRTTTEDLRVIKLNGRTLSDSVPGTAGSTQMQDEGLTSAQKRPSMAFADSFGNLEVALAAVRMEWAEAPPATRVGDLSAAQFRAERDRFRRTYNFPCRLCRHGDCRGCGMSCCGSTISVDTVINSGHPAGPMGPFRASRTIELLFQQLRPVPSLPSYERMVQELLYKALPDRLIRLLETTQAKSHLSEIEADQLPNKNPSPGEDSDSNAGRRSQRIENVFTVRLKGLLAFFS